MGINKAPIILAGLRTNFFEGRANATNPQALGKLLESLNCVAVIIQNRLNNLDDSGNPLELMVGTGGGCIWQLLPGVESPLIYVTNLNDVFVKVRVAVTGATTGVGAIEQPPGGIALNNAGHDYAPGDTLTIFGGSGGLITVNTVDGAGAILTWTLTSGGSGYSVGTNVSTTSDAASLGAGATFDILTLTINQVDFPFIVYYLDPVYQRQGR